MHNTPPAFSTKGASARAMAIGEARFTSICSTTRSSAAGSPTAPMPAFRITASIPSQPSRCTADRMRPAASSGSRWSARRYVAVGAGGATSSSGRRPVSRRCAPACA